MHSGPVTAELKVVTAGGSSPQRFRFTIQGDIERLTFNQVDVRPGDIVVLEGNRLSRVEDVSFVGGSSPLGGAVPGVTGREHKTTWREERDTDLDGHVVAERILVGGPGRTA